MKEAKVMPKKSESIAILKDALLAVKTSTSVIVRIKKYCRVHEIALWRSSEDGVLCHPSDGAA